MNARANSTDAGPKLSKQKMDAEKTLQHFRLRILSVKTKCCFAIY